MAAHITRAAAALRQTASGPRLRTREKMVEFRFRIAARCSTARAQGMSDGSAICRG